MSSLVDRIIGDPNSPFKADDSAELEKLPQDVLQRLVIGLQTGPDSSAGPGADDDTRKEDLRAELKACQKEIESLVETESRILDDLDEYGISESSVLDRFVPVTNQAQGDPLNDDTVWNYVQTSKSMVAGVLREGLKARDENRAKAIEVIVNNTNQYDEKELRGMFTPQLQKLAGVISAMKAVPQEVQTYNWDGLGLADRTVAHPSSIAYEAPLELPTTMRELPAALR